MTSVRLQQALDQVVDQGLPELTGIAAELGLDVELPRVLARFPGVWVEYGLVVYAYAQRNPKNFAA